jgi:hypothetical protein
MTAPWRRATQARRFALGMIAPVRRITMQQLADRLAATNSKNALAQSE